MVIDIGKNIRKIRELKNFSQQNVSDSIGITQKHLSRIENGQTSPTFDLITKIVEFYGISLNELLEFNENLIFNNNSSYQQGGKFIAYNNTDIHQVEELYKKLIAEKDKIISILEKNQQ